MDPKRHLEIPDRPKAWRHRRGRGEGITPLRGDGAPA